MTAQHTRLGSSDLAVFPLSLGGNVFGWTADRDTSFDVLDAYVAGGGNFVDTADVYSQWIPGNSGGESERIIGEWMSARHAREDVVVATKVGSLAERKGLGGDNIRAAVDESLERLGTDYIDLYYAHIDDEETPIEERIEALSGLVDAGKIRYIGLSNYSAARIDEWFEVTEREGFHKAVALQPHYNLMERGFENETRQAAARAGLAVVPYFALASGFLTGKYRDGADVDSQRAQGASAYLDDRGRHVLEVLDQTAAAHDTSVASVSLAWLRQQPTVVAPSASARTVEQLPDLLASAELTLTEAELAQLDQASAAQSPSA